MEATALETIILERILLSPALSEFISQLIDGRLNKLFLEQRLTRKKMAVLYDVHPDSIDNLNETELYKLGWRKIYVGSLPRFERIAMIEPSKEMYKIAKKK
ncbi:MAG TPA: hypothetical protein VHO50_07070 [Bacteroidales bacterium]|nr:hypothetical protein [Bacteroidales bacterium]